MAKAEGHRDPGRPGSAIRPGLANGLLVFFSMLAGYLLLEGIVFPLLLPHMPLRLHQLVNVPILAQSSKTGPVPEHYIAVAGDSYAKGNGDWLLDADPNANPPFYSGHVLHDLSGRDVISFGVPGAGSVEGFARSPLRQFRTIEKSPWYTLDPPDVILAYVYEGNDFDDNLGTLRQEKLLPTHGDASADPVVAHDFVQREARAVISNTDPALSPAMTFAGNALRSFVKQIVLSGKDEDETGPATGQKEDAERNGLPHSIARIDGKEVVLPDALQSPAMELTESELAAAMLVLKQSLIALRDAFPDAALYVVYIPSPLSTYRIESPTVSVQSYQGRQRVFPAAAIAQRSDRLCESTRQIADALDISFLDARPGLRAAAEGQAIHGPRDWKHFNRIGQTALAETIFSFVGTGNTKQRDR